MRPPPNLEDARTRVPIHKFVKILSHFMVDTVLQAVHEVGRQLTSNSSHTNGFPMSNVYLIRNRNFILKELVYEKSPCPPALTPQPYPFLLLSKCNDDLPRQYTSPLPPLLLPPHLLEILPLPADRPFPESPIPAWVSNS